MKLYVYDVVIILAFTSYSNTDAQLLNSMENLVQHWPITPSQEVVQYYIDDLVFIFACCYISCIPYDAEYVFNL